MKITNLDQLSPHGKLVLQMLLQSLQRLEQLGDEVIKQKVPHHLASNRDPKLVGDVEAELAAQSTAISWAFANNHRIKWLSEELEDALLGPRKGKCILVAVDGFDGTENLEKEEVAEFSAGTMVSVSLGHDPKYKDVVAGGCLMFRERWVLIADKEMDCVILFNFSTGEIHQIDKFGKEKPDPDYYLVDNYPSRLDAYLSDAIKAAHPRTGSTAATIVLLAGQGKIPWESRLPRMNEKFTALIADATDKKDIEQLVLYLVMTLLGGFMITYNGDSPKSQRFFGWGDHKGEQVFFMLVPNLEHHKYVMNYIGELN